MDEEQIECLKDKIKFEVRAEVKSEIKDELEKELTEKIENKLRVEIQNQIGCMWVEHFERFQSEESGRQNDRTPTDSWEEIEDLDGQDFEVQRAPLGFEYQRQNRRIPMCTNCRRWDHRSFECRYEKFCSSCKILGHNDREHQEWAQCERA